MTLLLVYLFLALAVSFFCSIAEAVLLSVRPSYVEALELKKARGAKTLAHLRGNLDRPLAAILTANTIAHTVGAAGVGAQTTVVFGSQYLGLASGILTVLVLILSEIIPKTLGATYWQQLAPTMGVLILGLTRLLYPVVLMTELITRRSSRRDEPGAFSRDEMQAMADLGVKEGGLDAQEHKIVSNLMKLSQLSVRDIMTPRSVIFSAPGAMKVDEFFRSHADEPFSRIPIHEGSTDSISGYVLKNDLLLAQAKDNFDAALKDFERNFLIFSDEVTAAEVFDQLLAKKNHIALVADEYGTVSGLVTIEDVVETLIGLEITDELDKVADMQALARKRWRERMQAVGINPENSKEQPE